MVSSMFGMVTTRRGYIRLAITATFYIYFHHCSSGTLRHIINCSFCLGSTLSIPRVLQRCHSAEMADYWLLLLVTRLKRETNRK